MKKTTDTHALKNLTVTGRYQIDGVKNLHLLVQSSPTGLFRKYFIFRFTYEGKRFDMSLGAFNDISLAEAKAKAQKFRGLVLNGINPMDHRKSTNQQISLKKTSITFKAFAYEYLERMKPQWKNEKHVYQWESTIRKYMIPVIGNLDMNEVTTEHVLQILTPIWQEKFETASRTRSRLERIISAAIATGIRKESNCATWRGHLNQLLPNSKPKIVHFRAVPYTETPKLIALLQNYSGVSTLALQFTILCASRTGETINALKSEISDDVWHVPPEKMKMGKSHIVPLSKQAQRIVEIAKNLNPSSPYIFSYKGSKLSQHAMLMLLRRVMPGYTVHGSARSAFVDWASDCTDFSNETIEQSLAHMPGIVERAYRRGHLLEKRKQLLELWSQYCYKQVS